MELDAVFSIGILVIEKKFRDEYNFSHSEKLGSITRLRKYVCANKSTETIYDTTQVRKSKLVRKQNPFPAINEILNNFSQTYMTRNGTCCASFAHV